MVFPRSRICILGGWVAWSGVMTSYGNRRRKIYKDWAGESKLAKVFGPLYIDSSIVPAFFFLFPHGKI